jgi:hypothetical protein
MMIYQVLLAIGALGILAMSVTGLRSGRGTRGRARARGRGARGRGRGSLGGSLLDAFLGLLSPLSLFGVCLGAGAAGMLTGRWWWAVLGGLACWKLVIEPLETLVLRFASEPAKNLEGTRATEAIVQSRFDANGQGMVSVSVDGQVRRVLARLAETEGDPREIKVGETLVVVDVDTKRNTCRVARF